MFKNFPPVHPICFVQQKKVDTEKLKDPLGVQPVVGDAKDHHQHQRSVGCLPTVSFREATSPVISRGYNSITSVLHFIMPFTLPETNSISPLKIGHPKRTYIFQPSIFRCKLAVSFREGIGVPFHFSYNDRLGAHHSQLRRLEQLHASESALRRESQVDGSRAFRRCFFFRKENPETFLERDFFFSDEVDRFVFFCTFYKELQEN